MTEELKARCEESVRLERNVSTLYRLYSAVYEEDKEFWWTLHLEEENHASLLESLAKSHLPFGQFPPDLLALDADGLREANLKVEAAIKVCRQQPSPAAEAYRFAVALEESAGELVLQEAAAKTPTSDVMKMVKEVIGDCKDHANRIRRRIAERRLDL